MLGHVAKLSCCVDPQPAAVPKTDVALTGVVCRAAISVMMGRDFKTIKFDRMDGNEAYASYVRPDDNTTWKNRCYLNYDRVVWSMVDLDGPGSLGPWRVRAGDEVIKFSIKSAGIDITQQFDDGSQSIDRVPINPDELRVGP